MTFLIGFALGSVYASLVLFVFGSVFLRLRGRKAP